MKNKKEERIPFFRKIYDRIYIANDGYCTTGNESNYIIHACKYPCYHRITRGIKYETDSPEYLFVEYPHDLYLNIIDPDKPLFMKGTFDVFLYFMDEKWGKERNNIIIHCNEGVSRAPSLGLLFLAKNLKAISNDSYDAAREDFFKIFPEYMPKNGIVQFLTKNWGDI
ncbi:MAG: hypothetical protein SV062_08155 [Thermodesulfobacteriota bacterium]|nr:hypothetical protein [Thermodesulfobacteriota bacterium]